MRLAGRADGLWVLLLCAACGGPMELPVADSGISRDGGGLGGFGGGSGGGGGSAGAGAGGGAAGVGGSAGGTGGGAGTAGSGGSAGSGGTGGGATDAGQLVAVSHPRELRGVWIAAVHNIDFPSAQGLSPAAARAELSGIVETAADAGLNALFFHVRTESDALYRSTRDPWSRFLTGTQGQDPGYDPLGTLLTLAHARGLEVHAWVNPYRAMSGSTMVATAPTHISRVLPQHAIAYGSNVIMDPSATAVRDWVVAEARDLVSGYDVDGLHFDDYFYPYPSGTLAFNDDAGYRGYVADGGTLGKSDWRRSNVNALVEQVSRAVSQVKPDVRFGISPFGIYRPGQPPGITGLDAYETLACDSLTWVRQGWVDYLAPQLYWSTTTTGQRFDLLVSWWAQQLGGGRTLMPGLGLYRGFSAAEYRTEVTLTRAEAPNAQGQLWFSYSNLAQSASYKALLADLYARPALPPPVATRRSVTVPPPVLTPVAGGVAASAGAGTEVRAFTVYGLTMGSPSLLRVVPATSGGATVPLPAGRYAVAAVSRADVESLGVLIDVP